MSKRRSIITTAAIAFAFIIPLLYGYLRTHNLAVLNPKGTIALQERDLMVTTVLLGLLVVLPVYILLFSFAWRYRESNKARYSPALAGNVFAETVWWAIPLIIIAILSVITWRSSHALDPQRPIASDKPVLRVQVIALEWKWLFIYPEQGIASVNYLQLPLQRPINFEITADAPMNSLWIPQLGSQIYAMPGMSSKLHLLASHAGTYQGLSANISGRGFADMRFQAEVSSQARFDEFVRQARQTGKPLNRQTYDRLAQPGIESRRPLYSRVEPGIYNRTVMKYTLPGGSHVR